MVDRGGLENRFRRMVDGGSNPSLSASNRIAIRRDAGAGRTGTIGNRVRGQKLLRGFESLSLRYLLEVTIGRVIQF